MDVTQFEQAILKLAFETDARITTASVAYYLGLPSRRCNELLNQLLAEGVLELDSDPEGNLYYRVPNKPQGGDEVLERLRRDREQPFSRANLLLSGPDLESKAEPQLALPAPEPEPPSSVRWVSAGESDDSAPISPSAFAQARFAGPTPDDARGIPAGAAAQAQPTPPPRYPAPGHRGDSLAQVTRRRARPDASINRCGASPVLIADSVRCDPTPFAAQKPVITSCDTPAQPAYKTAQDAQASDPFWQLQNDQWPVPVRSGRFQDAPNDYPPVHYAPGAGGELALRDDALSQPEHQPGMALLLSLILCGTGQIYNGEVSKGIMMMVLCFLLWFVLLGWVVHIWSIVDSVVVAERLNRTGS